MSSYRIRVRWRASLGLTGTILVYLTGPLVFPLLVALYHSEPVVPFVAAIVVTLSLGGLLRFVTDPAEDLGPREAFLAVSLIWLLVAIIGAIPFYATGVGTFSSPINALFESMSGLTTTGATVFQTADFEMQSNAILMWRQVLQWLGGLGILILATAVLSSLNVAGAQLMETETQMENVNRLTPKISDTAQLIWGLYVGLTLLSMAVYALLGAAVDPRMDVYNAVAHGFTSVSTAGFSPEPLSVGAFHPLIQWAVTLFMVLGATNFVLLYYVIHGNPMRLLRNEEFHFYLGLLVLFSTLVGLSVTVYPGVSFTGSDTVRHAVFNVTSMITTTGYASTDFNLWGPAAKHLLFLCMFLGGMAGSTTCSIKLVRWLVAFKSLRRGLFTSIHPEAIRPVRVSGTTVDEETVRDIYAYLLLIILIFTALTVFVVVDASRAGADVSEFEALGAAASTVLNIGPAFGDAGPYGTYDGFPTTTKAAMVVLMWVGRIEVIPVLVLFTKSFWTS